MAVRRNSPSPTKVYLPSGLVKMGPQVPTTTPEPIPSSAPEGHMSSINGVTTFLPPKGGPVTDLVRGTKSLAGNTRAHVSSGGVVTGAVTPVARDAWFQSRNLTTRKQKTFIPTSSEENLVIYSNRGVDNSFENPSEVVSPMYFTLDVDNSLAVEVEGLGYTLVFSPFDTSFAVVNTNTSGLVKQVNRGHAYFEIPALDELRGCFLDLPDTRGNAPTLEGLAGLRGLSFHAVYEGTANFSFSFMMTASDSLGISYDSDGTLTFVQNSTPLISYSLVPTGSHTKLLSILYANNKLVVYLNNAMVFSTDININSFLDTGLLEYTEDGLNYFGDTSGDNAYNLYYVAYRFGTDYSVDQFIKDHQALYQVKYRSLFT